jgi:3-oxoacyl-[acyl-carrier protein] reductase
MKIDLTGRVALVTGSTRGIGREIADTLARCGAKVVVTGRDQSRAEETAGQISAAKAFALDVSDTGAVTGVIDTIERELGSLDILVNNAGLTRDNVVMRLKDEDWDAVLDANLRGAFATIRAASRGMMKRRWGRIINITSVVGIMGNRGQANYAASKGGLIALTKSVARELASRNILANAVAPGFIDTEMTQAMTEEARKGMTGQIPLDRLGTAADVSAMVAFLASEHASYITGQVLVVDGGLAM